MQKQTRLKQVTTVKTTVRYRLVYVAGATLAMALMVGVGIFFYGNFGNNTESLAASKKKEGLGHLIKNIFAPKGPSAIDVTYDGGKATLSWLNGNDIKVVPDADGVIILRKEGIVNDEQSLTDLETDSSKYATAGTINGWSIIYNGNITRSFTDNNCPKGTYTYIVYLKKYGPKYTSAKNAARTIVFNGTGISETVSTYTKVDGLNIPSGCTLTVAKTGTLATKMGSNIIVAGTFALSGEIDGDAKSWTFEKGGQFEYNRNGGMTGVPVAKWESGSTCTMNGISNKIPPGLDQSFGNFTWDCPAQSTDLTLPKQLSVNGTITIKSTGASVKTLWLEGINTFKGDLIVNDATAKMNTKSKSQININSTTNQSIRGTWNFQTVTFNTTASISNEGTITVNKAMNLVSGDVLTTNSPFKIADGVVISETNGILTGTPVFLGTYDLTYHAPITTGDELTASATALKNLTIDCKAGAVTLNKTACINGELEFNNGKIFTGTYEVSMKNTSANSIKGYSSSSYIAGNLRRSTNGRSNYDFPIGTTANYELIDVNLYSTKGFSDLLAHFTSTKPDATSLPANLMLNGSAVSNTLDYGFWSVTPNSPLTEGTCTVTLNEKGQSNTATSVRCYCVITRPDGSSPWQMLGKHSMKAESVNNGVVTAARSKLTSLGDFAVGFSAISLLLYQSSFAAVFNSGHADILWRTTGDLMNYTSLIIERSQDAYGFDRVGELKETKEKGSTTEYSFTDKNPLPGTSYYRIKQTDSDGKISYSDIKFITNESKSNPSANSEK